MRLNEIIDKLELELLTPSLSLEREIGKGYASDLLSDVIAHCEERDVWITLQVHMNIVAVASMKELAAIITISGRKPDASVLEKAEQEEIPVLVSPLPAFEAIGRLYSMGIPGM